VLHRNKRPLCATDYRIQNKLGSVMERDEKCKEFNDSGFRSSLLMITLRNIFGERNVESTLTRSKLVTI